MHHARPSGYLQTHLEQQVGADEHVGDEEDDGDERVGGALVVLWGSGA